MRARAFLPALLLAATVLAGCGSSSQTSTSSLPALANDQGAIRGLVIDDRYRPIPDATVLLTPVGVTATTDGEGQFTIGNLAPGAYEARVDAKDHEAAPQPVEVKAGEYTELELSARRIFSQNGDIVTKEYSVFIPCAIDFVANGIVTDCTGDQSGDSFRAGFTADYRPYIGNATYLVSEMLANQDDRYEVQVRVDDGTDSGGPRFAVADFKGKYLRLQFKIGDTELTYDGQHNNVPFNITKPVQTILFSDSQGREELQSIPVVGGEICCGAGAHFGIEAKFVQTLFIGPPQQDISQYHVLQPSS